MSAECNYEALEQIVYGLLEQGIFPGVIARVFGLTPDLVRECSSLVRINRYGTDDLAEFTAHLQWRSIEYGYEVLQHGTTAERTRYASSIISKIVSSDQKRIPEKLAKSRENLESIMASMREGKIEREMNGPDPRFVPWREEDPEDDEDA